MATNETEQVRQLQRTLYRKAKQSKAVKFYSLYDKVWRNDVLREAWKQVRTNRGAPGVDSETIESIVSRGEEEQILGDLREQLRNKTYRFQPVRRVDMVICCRTRAEEALVAMRIMMAKMKLTVNESKTRICKLPEERFDFLGYTFGRCYSMKKGRMFLGTVPSKKRVQRICRAVSAETELNTCWQDAKIVVEKLNRLMTRWANYFCLGPVSKAYSAVDQHARARLRRWLCDKHKEAWPGYKRFPETSLCEVFGLTNLSRRTATLPWAKT